MHGWERLPCLKGEEELQYDHFLEQSIYLKTRLEAQHNKSYGKVKEKVLIISEFKCFCTLRYFFNFLILVDRSFSFNLSFLPIFLSREKLHSFGGVVLCIWLSIHYHSDWVELLIIWKKQKRLNRIKMSSFSFSPITEIILYT